MASILKRTRDDGSTAYLVQLRLKGHPTVTATFDKEKDARKWATVTEASIREGRHFRQVDAEDRKHTLSELIERYKSDVLPHKEASEIKQNAQLVWWNKHLGAFSLDEITPARLSDAKGRLSKERTPRGNRRGNGTVNRYLAVLSHVFTIAVKEWGWMNANPMCKVTRLRERRGRVRFLSDSERQRLFETCRTAYRAPALYPLVVIATYTGMRLGEILGLTWKDVDFERERVIVEQSKNGERRQVPFPPPALQVLRAWADEHRTRHGLVFPSSRNPRKPLSCRKSWEAAALASGLTDFHFHDLRHTAASYLAMSGASLQEIAEVLGHKTLAMVRRYAHLTESHTSSVVKRMSEKFAMSAAPTPEEDEPLPEPNRRRSRKPRAATPAEERSVKRQASRPAPVQERSGKGRPVQAKPAKVPPVETRAVKAQPVEQRPAKAIPLPVEPAPSKPVKPRDTRSRTAEQPELPPRFIRRR